MPPTQPTRDEVTVMPLTMMAVEDGICQGDDRGGVLPWRHVETGAPIPAIFGKRRV